MRAISKKRENNERGFVFTPPVRGVKVRYSHRADGNTKGQRKNKQETAAAKEKKLKPPAPAKPGAKRLAKPGAKRIAKPVALPAAKKMQK